MSIRVHAYEYIKWPNTLCMIIIICNNASYNSYNRWSQTFLVSKEIQYILSSEVYARIARYVCINNSIHHAMYTSNNKTYNSPLGCLSALAHWDKSSNVFSAFGESSLIEKITTTSTNFIPKLFEKGKKNKSRTKPTRV